MIVPDSIEPITGWKGLLVYPDKMSLLSPHGVAEEREEFGWPAKKRYTAHCPRDHVAPDADCSCGIYVAENWRTAFGYTSTGGALVEVYGWGKIVEHDIGWRVEHVYPKRIVLMNGRNFDGYIDKDGVFHLGEEEGNFFTQEFADNLSERYGVPVMIADIAEYPDKLSPRRILVRTGRTFFTVNGALQFLIWALAQSTFSLFSWVISAVMALILWSIPLGEKPPHEKWSED